MSSEQPFQLFNTLSGNKERLEAIDPKHLKIYACGPTVYNYAHIGNARMAVVFDTLVRTLRAVSYTHLRAHETVLSRMPSSA